MKKANKNSPWQIEENQKAESSQPKNYLDAFEINIQQCENLSNQEMISPILCATHDFCKKANVNFKDINQKNICTIGDKKSAVEQFEQTNEFDVFLDSLENEGKYGDVERFIFFVREKGKYVFIGYLEREQIENLETKTHHGVQKPCKKIMFDTLENMQNIWKMLETNDKKKRDALQPFVHLHSHTQYSIGDGYGTPKEIANAVWQKGFNAHAITDHGTLSGTIYMQKALKEKNIKPIIGIEAYLVEESPKEHSQHAVLLVKNKTGWKNLLKLHNNSVRENFYYRPKIMYSDLLKNCEGLILMSACVGGLINSKLENIDEAKTRIKELKEAFKDDFYIEVMPHEQVPNQIDFNKKLLSLAEEFLVKMVITCDVHYMEKEDKKIHNAIKAISLRQEYSEAGYTGDTFYLMQHNEIKESIDRHMPFLSNGLDQMFANTLEIADKCNFEITPIKENPLPALFEDENAEIGKLAYEGLKRINKDTPKYRAQLELELSRVIDKQYVRYFLIVNDYVKWCKENDILVGPGRGSVGSSLLAYCLGITQVDPIKYNLMFDRFISPIRKDAPDIDLDFEDKNRDKLFKHLGEKYGEKNTAKIATYSTWHGKGALRDMGRIFRIPIGEIERICNLVVTRSGGDARTDYCLLDTFSEFEQGKKFKSEHPEEADIAVHLESKIRHKGVHAAGQIICSKPLDEYIPIAKVNGVITTEWEKGPIEDLGLIKFDILGLKTLTVINETLQKIKEDINLPTDFDDVKVYDTVFKTGKTLGVFQLETIGLQKLSKQLQIDSFKLLYDATTLYRPGPLHSGQTADFILRHNKKKEWVYDHKLLESLTKDTYGLILYQEQVMKIMHDLGGFSWATSESARKIISKSKGKKEFEKMRKEFIVNSEKNHNIPANESGKIFDVVSTFGSYGFNMSHAVEYSIISYWTAWLKTYYPAEFFATLLSHEKDDNKSRYYIKEADDLGVKIKLPSINKSKIGYYILDNNIYAGFDAIKGIGKVTARKMIKYQPYKSFEDFLKRAKPSKTILETFAVCGCFEEFKIPSKAIYEGAEIIAKNKVLPLSAFGQEDFTEKEGMILREKYLSVPSDRPLIDVFDNPFKDKVNIQPIGDMIFDDFTFDVWVRGIVTYINFKQEGLEGQWTMFDNVLERRYAHLNISDGTGNVLVHLSPEQYTYYKKYLEKGTGFPVLIYGHTIPNFNKVYCDGMIVLNDIDNSNPLISLIDKTADKKLAEISVQYPKHNCGIIKNVSYKVSKNKNPYARIKLNNQEESVLCFKLDSDIFIAGEIIIYTMVQKPFIQIVRRIK